MSLLLEAVSLLDSPKDRHQTLVLADATALLGTIMYWLGLLEDADAVLSKSVALHESINQPSTESYTWLAQINQELGRLQEAVDYATAALRALDREQCSKNTRQHLHINLFVVSADLFEELGDEERAMKSHETAIVQAAAMASEGDSEPGARPVHPFALASILNRSAYRLMREGGFAEPSQFWSSS
jgi:tetratricopeptide (TPR) repeat protein